MEKYHSQNFSFIKFGGKSNPPRFIKPSSKLVKIPNDEQNETFPNFSVPKIFPLRFRNKHFLNKYLDHSSDQMEPKHAKTPINQLTRVSIH